MDRMKSTDWAAGLDTRLVGQLRFIMAADRLKSVTRGNRLADGSRHENTAEHSWHLALCALVLQGHAIDPVDIDRVIRMLIVHDIVEIDSGDTPLFDAANAVSQAEREQVAANRLFGLLPAEQAAEFRALWDEFEAIETPDARFAKALDRFQPILLDHAVGGGSWTDFAVDEAQLRGLVRPIEQGAPALWVAAEAIFADAVAKGWLKPAPAAPEA
ncbi:MAG: HD domain-containing protein [Rhizobiales bacterium]|nr:HD domain-containing protein [Hyphomicrobiales bacterium]